MKSDLTANTNELEDTLYFNAGHPVIEFKLTLEDLKYGNTKSIYVNKEELQSTFNGFSYSRIAGRKEKLYHNAIVNLFKKNNSLELYQKLLLSEIDETEFEDAMANNKDAYVTELNEVDTELDMGIIVDFVGRYKTQLFTYSYSDITELFSLDYSKRENKIQLFTE